MHSCRPRCFSRLLFLPIRESTERSDSRIEAIAIESRSRPKIRLTMLSPLSPSAFSILPAPSVKASAIPVTITVTFPAVLGRAVFMPRAIFATTSAPATVNTFISIVKSARMRTSAA